MSVGHNGVIELLNNIKLELEVQLTVNNNNEINMGKLFELSDLMPNRLMGSGLDSETKSNLIRFTNTLYAEATTLDNLRMNLNDVNRILTILQSTP